ncbi:hypothetical protein OXX79_007403 [Metschnikowia pulcherrima]
MDDDIAAVWRISEVASTITPYNGARNGWIIDEYIRSVTNRFIGNHADQRRLIKFSLTLNAAIWVRALADTPEWDEMSGTTVLERLRKAFYPDRWAQITISALMKHKRGNRPLAPYLDEFSRLQMQIPCNAVNDDVLYLLLLFGVGQPYASKVEYIGFRTFQESYDYLRFEVCDFYTYSPPVGAESNSTWPSNSYAGPKYMNAISSLPDPATLTKAEIEAHNSRIRASMICHYCRSLGHISRNCSTRVPKAKSGHRKK